MVYPLVFVASLIPGMNAVPGIVKQAELRFYPVVSDFYAESIEIEGGKVLVSVVGKKLRDCKPVSFDGYSEQNGVSFESPLKFINDPTPNNSRPVGTQSFGIWQFDIEDQPNAQDVYAIVEHDCGVWNLRSKLGPFQIREGNG